jgi:hemophore-related protein
MPMTNRLIVGCSGLVLALITATGIAYAEPDVNPIANSTCTYPQVMAAMTSLNSAAANQVSSNPLVSSWLQQLVASPPDGRRAMIAQVQGIPGFQPWTGLINQVAASCNNF